MTIQLRCDRSKVEKMYSTPEDFRPLVTPGWRSRCCHDGALSGEYRMRDMAQFQVSPGGDISGHLITLLSFPPNYAIVGSAILARPEHTRPTPECSSPGVFAIPENTREARNAPYDNNFGVSRRPLRCIGAHTASLHRRRPHHRVSGRPQADSPRPRRA